MKICLIDADSVIPNLALMRLSAYFKTQNHDVTLVKANLPYYPNLKKINFYAPPDFDKYYCSCVFSGHLKYIHGKNIIFGGTGFDLKTELPQEVESTEPDYSIYPENNTSYGFISRGCIRNCKFCVVPTKEGRIHQVSTVANIVRHKKVKFLDNNILALPEHKEILSELVALKIKCQFNQGLDIRLLDPENSKLLSKLKYSRDYVFAFDSYSYLPIIQDKIKLLDWRRPWELKFFVFCHPSMEISDIVKRVEWLKNKKCLPYIMRHLDCWESKYKNFYIDIASYCNQVHVFKSMTFTQFLFKRHVKIKRIIHSSNLYRDNM